MSTGDHRYGADRYFFKVEKIKRFTNFMKFKIGTHLLVFSY